MAPPFICPTGAAFGGGSEHHLVCKAPFKGILSNSLCFFEIKSQNFMFQGVIAKNE